MNMFFLTPLSVLTILLFPHKIFKLDIGVVWCFTKLISYYQINQGQLTLFTFLKHSKMSKSSIKAKKTKSDWCEGGACGLSTGVGDNFQLTKISLCCWNCHDIFFLLRQHMVSMVGQFVIDDAFLFSIFFLSSIWKSC